MCYQDHEYLKEYLAWRTHTNPHMVNIMSKYLDWFRKNGINPITPYGWVHKDAFSQFYITRFLRWYMTLFG